MERWNQNFKNILTSYNRKRTKKLRSFYNIGLMGVSKVIIGMQPFIWGNDDSVSVLL